jgi:uncharacterized protein (TIGR02147 family)
MKSIYQFSDYKVYLLEVENSNLQIYKGFRTRLAEKMGCQTAFVSQVFNNKAHLSLEQALRVSRFIKLDPDEEKYFLHMVQWARAGTSDLKSYFYDSLQQQREEKMRLKNRVGASGGISENSQTLYYSSWEYAAVHVLVTIPNYDSIEKIASALRIGNRRVSEILAFLIKSGLIVQTKDKLNVGEAQIHLDKSSVHILKHHSHWRMKAIGSITEAASGDVHYTTVSSLSKKDVEKIRSLITDLVQRYTDIVRPSKEETLYGFNLDFYHLLHS